MVAINVQIFNKNMLLTTVYSEKKKNRTLDNFRFKLLSQD